MAMVLLVCLAPVHAASPAFAPKLSWMPGDPASPVVTEPGRNILDNSSFEQGSGGWSSSASEFGDREPDTVQAWHGGQSLRLFSTREVGDSFNLCSPEFRAEAGGEYSVSCYARTSGTGVALRIAILGTAFDWQVVAGKDLGGEWQRIEATGKLGATRRQSYFVTISVTGLRRGLDVWVDAVQAERGPVSAYKPSREIEMGAVTDRFANTYYWDEPVVLRPIVANWGAEAIRGKIEYTIRDYRGAEVMRGNVEVDAAPGKTTRAEIPVGKWRGFGEALIDLTVPGIAGYERYRCTFATIPRRTNYGFAADPFFGVHGAGQGVRNWKLLEDLGCQTAKIYCGWGDQVEGKPLDLTGIDTVVDALLRHHIVPIVCLGTWVPGWAMIKGPDGKPTSAIDIDAYRRHIRQCVTHLTKVKVFESWNEIYFRGADRNTLDLMWAATDECKKARPDAIMMTNAVGGGGDFAVWLRPWLKARQGRPLDALALHYPWDTPRNSPERVGMQEVVGGSRRLAEASAGKPLPIYITESGYHGGEGLHAPGMAIMEGDGLDGWLVTPRQRAEWMVEQFLIARANGVKALCEFDWCGYPMGPPWYSSLAYNDMSPTAAIPAYATMTHLLAGAKVVRGLPVGRSPVRGLIVTRDGQAMTCLWSATGDLVVPAKAKGRALRVTDVVGAEKDVAVLAGVAVLKLSDGPIYVPGVVDTFGDPVTITKTAPGPWVEGKAYEVEATVTNPYAAPWKVTVRAAMPEGWRSRPTKVTVTLPAKATRKVVLRLIPGGPGAMGMQYRVEATTDEATFSAVAKVHTISAESAAEVGAAKVQTLDDFEAGVGRWITQCGEGAVATVEAAAEPVRGGAKSMHLHLQHGPPAGTWADTALPFDPPQKWSAYDGVSFWIRWRDKPKCALQIHLAEKGGGTYWAEVKASDQPNQWHQIVAPFADFLEAGWNPDPNGRLDLDSISVIAIVGVGHEGTSDFWIDDVEMWRK